MKALFSLALSGIALLGLSSCCMFSAFTKPVETTTTVKACGYKTVKEQVWVEGTTDAKGGMITPGHYETVKRKVPKYKEKKTAHWATGCWHVYYPDSDGCGTTGPKTRAMASSQGWSGSPNTGLVPTMKPLVD
jgi:hypothetical protein